jgi:acid stress-induced BolA-like protein IbaG/YrbA
VMMQVRGDKFKFNVIVVKELFEVMGGFFVQLL